MREASTWITLSAHFPSQLPAHLFSLPLLCQSQMVHSLPSYLQRSFLVVGVCGCRTLRARNVTHQPSAIKRRMKTFIDKRIAACLFILWTFCGATAGSITAGWIFLICSNLDHLQGCLTTRLENFDTPRSGAKSFCFDDSVKGGGRFKLDEGRGRDSSSS